MMELIVGGALAVAFAIIAGVFIRDIIRQVNRFLDDWTSAPKAIAPKPQRWSEAQLFEPVSQWVEDAERAAVAAERATVTGSSFLPLHRPSPGHEGGYLVLSPGEYVIPLRHASRPRR